MIVMALDPKTTHQRNPDCPMRIVPTPDGNWMCVDCGCYILQQKIQGNEIKWHPIKCARCGLLYGEDYPHEPTVRMRGDGVIRCNACESAQR